MDTISTRALPCTLILRLSSIGVEWPPTTGLGEQMNPWQVASFGPKLDLAPYATRRLTCLFFNGITRV